MQIVDNHYPYPVLSKESLDFINGTTFDVKYEIIEGNSFNNAKLKARFELVSEEIDELIALGKAAMFLHIECPRSAYRKIFTVYNNYHEIEIDPKKMANIVEVTGFILSKCELPNFTNRDIDQELYGESYVYPKLNKGDPLAIAYTEKIELDEIDEFTNVTSIITVKPTEAKFMNVDYDNDVIYVNLPKKEYNRYVNFSKVTGQTILTSTIMPALIYVLDIMASNSEIDDKKWYQVIEKKIELLNYTVNELKNGQINSVVLAQEILEDPISKMFDEIEVINNNGAED